MYGILPWLILQGDVSILTVLCLFSIQIFLHHAAGGDAKVLFLKKLYKFQSSVRTERNGMDKGNSRDDCSNSLLASVNEETFSLENDSRGKNRHQNNARVLFLSISFSQETRGSFESFTTSLWKCITRLDTVYLVEGIIPFFPLENGRMFFFN